MKAMDFKQAKEDSWIEEELFVGFVGNCQRCYERRANTPKNAINLD
jgi:hypothetical protein